MREWKNGENVVKVNFFYTISKLQTTFLLFSLMKTDKTGQERRMVVTGNHRRILNRVSSTELEAGGGNGKKVAGNHRKRQYSPFAVSPFSALPVSFLPPGSLYGGEFANKQFQF